MVSWMSACRKAEGPMSTPRRPAPRSRGTPMMLTRRGVMTRPVAFSAAEPSLRPARRDSLPPQRLDDAQGGARTLMTFSAAEPFLRPARRDSLPPQRLDDAQGAARTPMTHRSIARANPSIGDGARMGGDGAPPQTGPGRSRGSRDDRRAVRPGR